MTEELGVRALLGSLDTLAGVPLQLALDNTGVGLVACDADGRLTLLSPALQEMFGMDFEPLAEEVLVERLPHYECDGITRMPAEQVPLARARRGEFVNNCVVTMRHQDGSAVHLRCNAVPLQDAAGVVTGAISLVQDVTLETDAAWRAEQLRTRLVETINHEFRTPLAALLGHVELIHDQRSDVVDPELAAWLAAIERSGWRLRDLVLEVADLVNTTP